LFGGISTAGRCRAEEVQEPAAAETSDETSAQVVTDTLNDMAVKVERLARLADAAMGKKERALRTDLEAKRVARGAEKVRAKKGAPQREIERATMDEVQAQREALNALKDAEEANAKVEQVVRSLDTAKGKIHVGDTRPEELIAARDAIQTAAVAASDVQSALNLTLRAMQSAHEKADTLANAPAPPPLTAITEAAATQADADSKKEALAAKVGALSDTSEAISKAIAKLKKADEIAQENTRKFAGLDFGVGITLTIDQGSHDRVEEAELDKMGKLRIKKDHNDIPRIMLESHYLFVPDAVFPCNKWRWVESGMWGFGPFVGIQNGSEEVIEAIGMGVMIGFRRSKKTSDSFNFGLGGVVDPKSKTLGDGLKEGDLLVDENNNPDPSQIRFKETAQWGLLFMFSYSF